MDGLRFIQDLYRNSKTLNDVDLLDFPLETIPAHLKQYLTEKDQASNGKSKPIKSIYPYRYEFYVYDQLNKNLANNKIYANDTTQYKNFEDDIKLKMTAREKRSY